MERRGFLKVVGAGSVVGAGAIGALGQEARPPAAQDGAGTGNEKKPRFRHSVCRWCFDKVELREFCREVKAAGFESVELVGVAEWPVLAEYGLRCAVSVGPTKINKGFNRVENHGWIEQRLEEMLQRAAAAPCGACPNLIVFSGNNAGITDDEGLRNCEVGLKRVAPLAERAGVTLVMELLNSKIDHPDYMARRTAWGVELVRRVGSERFKLLYDIYHMQIMEGDIIRTVQDNVAHIAHFHVAGVPGRHDPDEEQELNYRAIMQAIAEAGYTGYIGQEFLARGTDWAGALRGARGVCEGE